MDSTVFIHPTAEVSPKAKIGKGTKVWNHAQVREDAIIGENCNISTGVYVDFGVKIGNNVKLQNYVCVYHGVTIEDYVQLGPLATTTNDLFPRSLIWDDSRLSKTLIKKGASVGANATLCPGITLGEYCLVGAGSVVTKDVVAHGLVLGNPARLVGFVCDCGFKLGFVSDLGSVVRMKCSKCGSSVNIPKADYEKLNK